MLNIAQRVISNCSYFIGTDTTCDNLTLPILDGSKPNFYNINVSISVVSLKIIK